jgi:hypothetical protein
MTNPYRATVQSIAAAKQQAQRERDEIHDVTGVVITEDGQVQPTGILCERHRAQQRHVWVIGCPKPGCRFTASARSEGRAIRALSAHVVRHEGR